MRLLLITTMMFFVASASAGLYKWVDEEGNVHYSQKRPRDQEYKRLKAPPPAPESSKPLYQSATPASGKKSNASSTAKAETEKNLKIRAENCTKAKKNLQLYQIYRRVRDKDGNVKPIDDKVRAQQIESAKKAISQYCD